MKVRIGDIADAAGVSKATVSNALSGNNRISETTRLRILELARRMGYQDPSLPALNRGIRFVVFRKHGRVVIDSPFFSELISGIERACRKNQYELTFSYIQADEKQSLADLLCERKRPILLLATEMDADDIRPFLKAKTPLMVLDSQFLDMSFQSVFIDNVKAGYLAGEYFCGRGHRRVGLISSSRPFNNVRDRRIGLETALREHGLTLSPEDVFPVDPTLDGAYADMGRLLAARTAPLPSALFAFNDIVGAAAIRAMKESGVRVPQDVSVIGMDNMPLASIVSPALTSVNVPKFSMGFCAVSRLIFLAGHAEQPVLRTAIDVQLVERDSVADHTGD